MSLVSLLLPSMMPQRSAVDAGATLSYRDVTSDFWYTLFERPTESRVSVTQESALTYSAVWAATRLLSVTPAGLPLNLYRRDIGQTSTPQDDKEFIQFTDSRNELVDSRPNQDMIGLLAKAQAFQQMVNAGNAYFEIERNRAGDPIALWPILYWRVQPVYDEDTGELLYRVTSNSQGPVYIDAKDILHFAYPMSRDGVTGLGVVDRAKESIGLGLATERYGASFFGSGGMPRIVVKHPQRLSPEARKNFHKEWSENLQDRNHVALLMEGADLKEIVGNNENLQFLTTRQHNIEEIARWYGVAVHLIQRSVNPGVNNVEQLSIEFLKFGLLPLTLVWEQELNKKLLRPEERPQMYFRFNFEDLLRPDSKTLAEVVRILIQIGVLTPDEGRRMIGKNPMGGPAAGLFMQGAMMPIDKLGQQENVPQLPQGPDEQRGTDANALVVAHLVAEAVKPVVSSTTAFQGAVQALSQQSAEQAAAVGTLTATVAAVSEASAKTAADLQAINERLAAMSDSRTALKKAARDLMLAAVTRMMRVQGSSAKHAAQTPSGFGRFLDAFAGEHQSRFAEAVTPLVGLLAILDVEFVPATFAESQLAISHSELLNASGCQAKELPARVEALTVEWESKRAAAVCDAVIGGQAA